MNRKMTAKEARQGRLGRPVLLVLAASLALTMVFLIGTGIWLQSNDQVPAEQSSVGQGIEEPRG